MTTSNRGQIRAAIIRDVFKRTDKDDQINQALNDTLREMAAAVAPRQIFGQFWIPSVVGQEDYMEPSDLLRVMHPIRLIDTTQSNDSSSSYPMRHITKQEYDRLEPNPNATTIKRKGRPTHYTIYEHCILVTPIPDAATYRFEGNFGREQSELAADVDEPFLTDQWLETIKAGMLARLFNGLQMYDESDKWNKVYNFGYAGQGGVFAGGLTLLKESDQSVQKAPLIVDPRNF